MRVAADAFGVDRPARDLYLSPGHSVCVNVLSEVLIPIQELVNGSTVAYVDVDTVTYWHVELDSHDILLAENMQAESFLEMGANRTLLSNEAAADLPIEVLQRSHADFCRRFVDDGPLLAAVRDELARRADELGWMPSDAVDIVGVIDDRHVKPLRLPGEALFALPAGAGDVLIRSCLTAPSLLGGTDSRLLGIAVYGLVLVTDSGEVRPLDLDSSELCGCFHDGERHQHLHYRWTRGDLVTPHALLEGLPGPLMLRLTYEPNTLRGWSAPKPVRDVAPTRERTRLMVVA